MIFKHPLAIIALFAGAITLGLNFHNARVWIVVGVVGIVLGIVYILFFSQLSSEFREKRKHE